VNGWIFEYVCRDYGECVWHYGIVGTLMALLAAAAAAAAAATAALCGCTPIPLHATAPFKRAPITDVVLTSRAIWHLRSCLNGPAGLAVR